MKNIKFTVPTFSLENEIDMIVSLSGLLSVELKDDEFDKDMKNLLIKWICRDKNNNSIILIKCYTLENDLEVEEASKLLYPISPTSLILSHDLPCYFINDDFIRDENGNYYIMAMCKYNDEIVSNQIKISTSTMIQMAMTNAYLSDLSINLNNKIIYLGISNLIEDVSIVKTISINRLAKLYKNNVAFISKLTLENDEEFDLLMSYNTICKIRKKLENKKDVLAENTDYVVSSDHVFSIIINNIHYFAVECKNEVNKTRVILFTDEISDYINNYIDSSIK